MLDESFLKLVRCPIRHTPLAPADQALLDRINAEIARGQIFNRLDEQVDEPLDGALVNEDRSLLYPVRHEIPTLIADEAIELPQVTLVEETGEPA